MKRNAKLPDHPERSPAAIGERLYTLRRALKLPQIIISEQCGIEPYTWSAVERGRTSMSWEYASLISDKTGVTLDYIFMGATATLPPKLRAAIRREMRKHTAATNGKPLKRWAKRGDDKITEEQERLLQDRRDFMKRSRAKWSSTRRVKLRR